MKKKTTGKETKKMPKLKYLSDDSSNDDIPLSVLAKSAWSTSVDSDSDRTYDQEKEENINTIWGYHYLNKTKNKKVWKKNLWYHR